MLADLSVNFVERQVLLCGHAASRIEKDYGLDLLVHTFTNEGEIENGEIMLQIKATDSIRILQDGNNISLTLQVADLKLWQSQTTPIILILYDGLKEKAYWLYVQQYLQQRKISHTVVSKRQNYLTVRIPIKNVLNRKAIDKFRQIRDNIQEQIDEIQHGS